MNTTTSALENALYCLVRAEEAARFFHREPEIVAKIQILKRATAKVLREVKGEGQAKVALRGSPLSPDSLKEAV